MLFKNIMILDENFETKENMFVGVQGERIDYIGTEMPAKDYGEMIDGTGRILMPGFYNAHAHSPMTVLRGYGENLALQEWLTEKIFPFEDRLTGEDVYWATLLCMAESLRFGIVSTSDLYFFVSEMTDAVVKSGAKNNICRSLSNFDGTPFDEMKSAQEFKAAVRDLNGAGNGRVIMEASLHAEFTSDEATARSLAAYAKEHSLRMQVHVSETKIEHEECKERHGGRTPTQYLSDCGIFDVPAIAAHCVWIEGEDFDILKDKGVTVATCPCSNLKLASGICNTPEILRRGIKLAIGTDGVSSNNSLNFLEEMKTMALLGKISGGDPTAITPKQVLYAATRGGALAQGRDDCGLVKEGFRADLIMLRTDVPNMHPVYSMDSNLVYSASAGDIMMTMVDGKVLYKDGEYTTIDVREAIAETNRSVKRILDSL